MHLRFNLLRALSRLLISGAAGAVLQFLSEVADKDKADHTQWLVLAGLAFCAACVSFATEEQFKPRPKLHPDSLDELEARLKGHRAAGAAHAA
jgi:hypothetical protein